MLTQALIINAAVLFAVLEADLGPARKLSRFRLARPILLAAAIIPLFLTGVATSGDGLVLEVAGTAVGLLLGIAAALTIHVYRQSGTGRTVTRAGWPYALVWVVVIGARSAFSYGASHWFSTPLGTWMAAHQVTTDALTASLIFMAVAMMLTRTLSLAARRHTGVAALAY